MAYFKSSDLSSSNSSVVIVNSGNISTRSSADRRTRIKPIELRTQNIALSQKLQRIAPDQRKLRSIKRKQDNLSDRVNNAVLKVNTRESSFLEAANALDNFDEMREVKSIATESVVARVLSVSTLGLFPVTAAAVRWLRLSVVQSYRRGKVKRAYKVYEKLHQVEMKLAKSITMQDLKNRFPNKSKKDLLEIYNKLKELPEMHYEKFLQSQAVKYDEILIEKGKQPKYCGLFIEHSPSIYAERAREDGCGVNRAGASMKYMLENEMFKQDCCSVVDASDMHAGSEYGDNYDIADMDSLAEYESNYNLSAETDRDVATFFNKDGFVDIESEVEIMRSNERLSNVMEKYIDSCSKSGGNNALPDEKIVYDLCDAVYSTAEVIDRARSKANAASLENKIGENMLAIGESKKNVNTFSLENAMSDAKEVLSVKNRYTQPIYGNVSFKRSTQLPSKNMGKYVTPPIVPETSTSKMSEIEKSTLSANEGIDSSLHKWIATSEFEHKNRDSIHVPGIDNISRRIGHGSDISDRSTKNMSSFESNAQRKLINSIKNEALRQGMSGVSRISHHSGSNFVPSNTPSVIGGVGRSGRGDEF